MENSYRRQSLIPSFLYSSPLSSSLTPKTLALDKMTADSNPTSLSSSPANKSFVIPAPSEPGKVQMHSPQYYAACTAGGILSCGLTHMAVTPLDLVKCNMQVRIFRSIRFYGFFILCFYLRFFPHSLDLSVNIIHLLDQICYGEFSSVLKLDLSRSFLFQNTTLNYGGSVSCLVMLSTHLILLRSYILWFCCSSFRGHLLHIRWSDC